MISVIIPLYNAARFIGETLASLQSQTYTDWECIVVDDGSTDNSADLVKRIAQSDNRIRYVFQSNAGPSAARNHGLRLAHGEYIQFLDADDWFPSERFENMLAAYAGIGENIILYSSLLTAAENDIHLTACYTKKTQVGDIDFRRMYGGFGREFAFIPGAVLFPRTVLRNVAWNESLRASEDWNYYLQLSQQGCIFRNVPQPLFVYRTVQGSLSNAISRVYEANLHILEKYRGSEDDKHCHYCLDFYRQYAFLGLRNDYQKKKGIVNTDYFPPLPTCKERLLVSFLKVYIRLSNKIIRLYHRCTTHSLKSAPSAMVSGTIVVLCL